MVYVAFLRGINVGGKAIVSMAAVRRTYVLLLWKELDDRRILDQLPVRPGVDNVRYAPGAVIWQVDRRDIAKSRMSRMVGTPYYKQITIRRAKTMRKLNEIRAGTT